MNTHQRPRIAAALTAAAVASALTIAGGVALAPAASAAPAVSVDYFADSFAGLREGSVFTPVTFERFERLLESDGTFAFLIGGPADATTSATVAEIDAAAQQHGIDTVYAFDPRLDGVSLDIRTTSSAPLAALYTRLAATLNKDTTPEFGTGSDPYLFIYDRAHTEGGAEDRIIASIGGVADAASIDLAAYRTQLDGLFGGVQQTGEQSQFEFFRDAMNSRHSATYADASLFGGDILTAADGANFVLQSVTYPELVNLLESDGEHVILFGGTWCHNTRAVVHEVNRAAAASGVETVYVFDLKLDGLSNAPAHIRDSASEFSYLYGDLVEQYLPNLRTQYVPTVSAGQRVEFFPGGDTSAPRETALKLQVPYLISYNKDASNGPITKDWLRENADGTIKEYMTEYWWVAGLPGKMSSRFTPETWPAEQAKNWAFAAEAVAKLDVFFGLAEEPEVPEVVVPPVTAAITVTGELRPGGAINISGTGFAAGAVTVEIHSTPQSLGTATAASDGTFTLGATIPASVEAGAHDVVVFANGTEIARTAVTIGAAAGAGTGAGGAGAGAGAGASGDTVAPGAAGTGQRLATTGGGSIPTLLLGTAALLLLTGAGALVVRRRAGARG